MDLGRAALIGTNRKSVQDFQREDEEFNARKKQRKLAEQMGSIQLEQAQRDLNAPKLPFQGNSEFAQIGNEAYRFNINKGMDEDTARQKAIDMFMGTKVDYTPTVNPRTGETTFIPKPRGAVFGDPMAASQQAIGQRQGEVGVNPNQRPDYMTPNFNPNMGVGSEHIGAPELQVNDMNEADILAAITPVDTKGVVEQAPMDMPTVPNIEPWAHRNPDVQKDIAKKQMSLPIDQQRMQMETQQELLREQALAEQKKQREAPETKNFAERAFIQSMDDSRNINSVIDKAIQDTGMLTAGFGGSVMGNFAGSGATDLQNTLKTIEADAAFTRLQEMRDSSKTGGALGAISERELGLLSSARAALDASQSPEQLKENLARYKAIRNNALSNVAEAFKEDYGYYPKGYNGVNKQTDNDAQSLIDYYSGL